MPVAWCLLPGAYGLVLVAWGLLLGDCGLGHLAWGLWLGIYGLGLMACGMRFGAYGLGPMAWGLLLGAVVYVLVVIACGLWPGHVVNGALFQFGKRGVKARTCLFLLFLKYSHSVR